MKNLFILLAYTLILFHSSTPVFAQTASPSGTIRDSVKQKVQEELSRIQKAVAKKGFVGSLTSKTDATLTITTVANQTRTLNVTVETTVKLAGGKDGTIADIKANDFILAMGDVDSQNTMSVKRLLVITPPAADKRVILTGKASSVTSNSLVLTNSKNEKLDIKAIAATKYNDKVKFTDIKADSTLVIIATPTTSGGKTTYTALRIHLIN